ncbi:MAG TPA: ABC transporter permease [Roseiarcus sp.]|nr:ABC transporter permease [Roseiarcus sp.]
MAEINAPADEAVSTTADRRQLSLAKLLTSYSLLILTAILIIGFSLLLPRTFPTEFNIRSILGTQSVIALLALAVMVPLAAGQYDLSVGFVLGITQMAVIGLQIDQHLAWPLAVVLALAVGGLIGLANGLLVTVAKIDSFIATLASGTFAFGVTNWYSNGQQIAGAFPDAFTNIANVSFLGYVPLPAVIVAIIAAFLYVILEYLSVGRRLYALGANPRMAELVGIPARDYTIVSFAAAGLLAGVAGVILGAQLQAGQPDLGPTYLLPAFVGALLGATSFTPGRVNVPGTLVSVLLLAVGIAGLQQLGAQFYVQYLFNGATLALAVGLAGFAARRRTARLRQADVARKKSGD